MSQSVSVVMIVKDASRTLFESLSALHLFEEVVVLDNGSTDDTMSIAKSFANVKVYESSFIGFGPLKNLAASYAKHSWILSVDSDEILSKELVDEILALELDPKNIYAIIRDNYYNRKLMRCCGWEDDRVDRLYYRDDVQFNQNRVHESLLFPSGIQRVTLRYRLKHYTYKDAEELIGKMQYYSTLWARDHAHKKRSSPSIALLRALFAFLKFYFFKKGFLSGYEGLVISWTNANSVFYKYIKLYEINRTKEDNENSH